MVDLWPDDITIHTELRSPVNILKEQASLLGDKTQNLVEAEVKQLDLPHRRKKPFAYRFDLVAPALGGYRFTLFRIYCDIRLYPVEFSLDEDILEEIMPGAAQDPFREHEILAGSEEEFLDALGMILRAQKTKQVITAMLSQTDSSSESGI